MSLFWIVSIIFCAYAVYRVACRLFPASFIEQLALTILLWVAFQILSLTAVGFVGLLTPLPAALLLFFLSVGLMLVTSRLPQLLPSSEPLSIHVTMTSRERLIIIILIFVGFIAAVLRFAPMWVEATTGNFIDVVNFEIPQAVNFYQAQSIWIFEGRFPYYNYGFHLLHSAGMWISSNYALTPITHVVPFVSILLYMVLIGDWTVKKERPALRLIIGLMIIVTGIALSSNDRILLRVGKNDQVVAMILLASIYYWVRYWQSQSRDKEAYLALVGIALGVGLSAKFSVFYWLAVFGGLHFIMMLRQHDRFLKSWIQQGIRHFLLVGIPVLLWAGMWFARSRFGYSYRPEDTDFFNKGWGNTIVNLWHTPILMFALQQWLPLLMIVVVGFVMVMIVYRHRFFPHPIVFVGLVAIIMIISFLLFSDLYFAYLHGPGAIVLSIALVLMIAYRRARDSISIELVIVCAWVLLSGMLYIVSPFSAWTTGTDYITPQVMYIEYRYQPTLMYLGVVIICASLVPRIISYFRWERGATPYEIKGLPISYHQIASGFLLVLLVMGAVRILSYQSLKTITPRTPTDAQVYSWVTENLHDTSILAHDAMLVYLLYGDDLSNRVHFWVLDSDWSLENVEHFVTEHGIEYLILPQNDAFQTFKETYSVQFEDEYHMILSTENHPET